MGLVYGLGRGRRRETGNGRGRDGKEVEGNSIPPLVSPCERPLRSALSTELACTKRAATVVGCS